MSDSVDLKTNAAQWALRHAYYAGYFNPAAPESDDIVRPFRESRPLLRAFWCGQSDAQNKQPMNFEYRSCDYDHETCERIGKI